MAALKANIITQLKKDILVLQGVKPLIHPEQKIDLGNINSSFPLSQFPLGVNHEFICKTKENLTTSSGFIAGILSTVLQKGGVVVWISSSQLIFPPTLILFSINPEQIIFIHLKNQKEILWATEEALKCEGLTAVVAEVPSIDLTISRRLQLATEQSKVTGFLLRYQPKQLSTTSCVCRWQILSLKSETENGMPGIGFPRWQVELLKVRNGKTGSWQIEWRNKKFVEVVSKNLLGSLEHKEAV